MIWRLVWRDPYWRGAWLAALVCSAVWVWVSRRGWASSLIDSLVVISLALCCSPGAISRATRFQVTLPVSARDWLRSRLLSLLCLVWAPVLAALVLSAVGFADPTRILDWAKRAAILTTIVALTLSVRAGRSQAPVWIMVLGLQCSLALVAAPRIDGAPLAACAVVSLAVALVALHRAPEAFETSPVSRHSRLRRSSSVTAGGGFWWMFVRQLWSGPEAAVISLAFAVVCSWYMDPFWGLVYAAPASGTGMLGVLPWIAALPISRRRVRALTLLPALTISVLAFLAYFHEPDSTHKPALAWTEPSDSRNSTLISLQPAYAFWRFSRNSSPPLIRAPWGEVCRPEIYHHPFGFTFYNPYSVGSLNSRRFVEWQFERATQAVYGHPIPLARDRELQRGSIEPLTRSFQIRIIEFAGSLVGVMLIIFATQLPRWRRTRAIPAAIRFSLSVVICLCVFSPFLFAPGMEMPAAFAAVRLARILPENPVLLIAVFLAALLALYRLLEKQFEETDPWQPPRTSRLLEGWK